MSAVISDAAFLTVKVPHGRYQSYNYPSLRTILLFSKMNWSNAMIGLIWVQQLITIKPIICIEQGLIPISEPSQT